MTQVQTILNVKEMSGYRVGHTGIEDLPLGQTICCSEHCSCWTSYGKNAKLSQGGVFSNTHFITYSMTDTNSYISLTTIVATA